MIGPDRLSIRAREALQRAGEIVVRYGHNRIDTEHLLLALVDQTRSPVPKLLESLQVDSSALIDRVVFALRASPRTGVAGGMLDKLNLTERTRNLIEQAGFEADLLDDTRITPEYLFLAVFYEQGTPAVQILTDSGLSRKRFLESLVQYRSRNALNWDE